jgi:hypothetical protein
VGDREATVDVLSGAKDADGGGDVVSAAELAKPQPSKGDHGGRVVVAMSATVEGDHRLIA